jgi:hypothetical protein
MGSLTDAFEARILNCQAVTGDGRQITIRVRLPVRAP